ncbi:MAG: 50S ribosomal protein L6 [Planctomycetota bacterium]|nr:50S ribosomal protein L6 [Planctomycetota bacterium]
MSRIGKAPIAIPGGVPDAAKSHEVSVKGPKGNLAITSRPEVHGLTRALIQNMVTGVHTGFEKRLEIVGVGWNAKAAGNKVTLNIGFCHTVDVVMPKDVTIETPAPTKMVITGPDKQAVGQAAAEIRAVRPPEPYKGKGIRYEGEYVRRKAGKSFGA